MAVCFTRGGWSVRVSQGVAVEDQGAMGECQVWCGMFRELGMKVK